jgi:hypothetical protein
MVKRGFCPLFINREARIKGVLIFSVLILITIAVFSYLVFGAGSPTCDGQICSANEKCVFDVKQTAVCVASSVCGACPSDKSCTINKDGSVKCGLTFSFCSDKKCDAGKICAIDLREMLKCRNLNLCNGVQCVSGQKCVKDAQGIASCQSVKSCSELKCPVGQMCKEEILGVGKCVQSKKVIDAGVEKEYAYESCLLEKPKFLDDKGEVQDNYCYGKDKIPETNDDCGCPLGLNCNANTGKCDKFCSDGTISERCSRNQPKYCDVSGNLIDFASGTTKDSEHPNGCGCSLGKRENLDNGCSGENFFDFMASEDFTGKGALFSDVNITRQNSIVFGYPGKSYINTTIPNCKGGYYWINHPVLHFWAYDSSFMMSLFNRKIVTAFDTAGYQFWSACYDVDNADFPAITCSADKKILRDYESYCFIPDSEKNPSFEINVDNEAKFNSIEVYFGLPYIVNYRIEYLPAGMDYRLEQNWKVLYEGSNGNVFKENSSDYFDGNYYSENDLQYRIEQVKFEDSSLIQKTDDDLGIKNFVKDKKVVLEEGIWNGNRYGYFIREIKLDKYISADRIRLVPLTWEPNAAIYRIFVYDKSANLKLNNGPLIESAAGLTYLSGQFQLGGEYDSPPSFLDVPSKILDYSTFKWTSDVEKRAPVVALDANNHGTRVDAFITGLDRNYLDAIKLDVDNGPWLDCSDCDFGYRYFGVDYTNNIESPNGVNWNLASGEGKRFASNTDVQSVGSTKLYYDPNCANAGGVASTITSNNPYGGIIRHEDDGAFKDILKVEIDGENEYCTAFPVALSSSSLGVADSVGQNHGVLAGGISLDTSSYVGTSGSSANFIENTDNYIKVNSFEDLDIGTGDFTFSFWFKLDPAKKNVLINGQYFYNYRVLFFKQPTNVYMLTNPNLGYTIWSYDQSNNGVRDLVFVFQLGKGGAYSSSLPYNPSYLVASTNTKMVLDPSFDPYDGRWHQVVFMLDRKKNANGNTYSTSFIDGAEASLDNVFWTGSLANFVPDNLNVRNDAPLYMGTGRASDNWVGGIDDVAIYHRTLNRDQINTLYNDQKAGLDILQESRQDLKSDLAAYWKFDGANSSVALREKDESFKTQFLVLPKDINANRLVVEELKNNIQRIKIWAEYGDDSTEYLADYRKIADNSNKNVESVIDFDIPLNKRNFCSSRSAVEKDCFSFLKVELYSKDSADKIMNIWNIGVYVRPDSNLDTASDSSLRFLFKSAKTLEGLAFAPWHGRDGSLIDMSDPLKIADEIAAKGFSTSGQSIGGVHQGNQWFQWKAIFLPSSTKLSSPILSKVNIGYFGGRDKSPESAIRFDSDDIAVGREVVFDGSVSEGGGGKIIKYKWEFSGGIVIESQIPIVRHAFSNPGINFVSLTITNEGGLTSKFTQYFLVAPYDCFDTREDSATPNSNLFEVSPEDMANGALKVDVLQKFADASGIPINSIDTPEEYMAAALYYTYTQITYRSDDEIIKCVENAGINVNSYPYYNGLTSLPLSKKQVDDLKKNSAFTSGSCACATPYCGDCKRFSIFYTAILRAMGVNSKCIYSAVTDNHATNIVNYHGKFRIVEPQVLSLDYAFNSKILEEWLGDSGAQKVSTLFVRGVVNDKVGSPDCSFGDSSCPITASTRQSVYFETAKDAEKYVRNPVGSNGLPDSIIGARCIKTLDRTIYGNYSSTAQFFGMDSRAWAWDPATLFEDICA